MSEPLPLEITKLLNSFGSSDRQALDSAALLLYDRLRELAKARLRGEREGHTLEPTALVHEVYLRLAGQGNFHWENRGHFLACAARIMRHVLINHAKGRGTLKRGGEARRVPLDALTLSFENRALDLVALGEALERLSERDEVKGQIVELRFFGGLTIAEAAEVLNLSHATVEREWRFARAWLFAQMSSDDTNP